MKIKNLTKNTILSAITSSILMTSVANAQDINIINGWQLKGTETGYVSMNNFNKSCIDMVWTYDASVGKWNAYSPNANTTNLISANTEISTLSKINSNDGFWIKGNSNCSVSTNLTKINDISSIIGKEFANIIYSNLIGAKKEDLTLVFNNDILTLSGEYGSETATYTTTDGITKITFDDWVDYMKILNISSNIVSVCIRHDPDDIKTCTTPNQYFVESSIADSFVTTKNSSSDVILTDKTLVTEFSEIQNKDLYQLHVDNNSFYTEKIKIDSNGKYTGTINTKDNYNGTFENGKLHVTGFDNWDQENGGDGNFDETYQVYKYNLIGKTISAKEFAHEDVFDDEDIATMFPDTNFTFTSGNMYCHILWRECWLDEDAFTQMETQAKSETISVTNGFTQSWLDNNIWYIVQDWSPDDKELGYSWLLRKKFIDGKVYGDDSEYTNDNWGFGTEPWDSYTITSEGYISQTGVPVKFKIQNVYDDYMEVYFNLNDGNFGLYANVYFEEAKAKEYLKLNSISVTNGFGANWLDGKTLWTVDTSGSSNILTDFNFTSNKIAYGEPYNVSVDYSVMDDGIIDTIEDNNNTGHEYYRIIAIDGTKISLCEGEVLSNVKSCNTPEQWFFTNQTDAQTYFDSL